MSVISFSAFLNLFFPKNCIGCETNLTENDDSLCLKCTVELPETKFTTNNPLENLFKGKVNIENSYAFLAFKTKSSVQNMMHELKYKKQERSGKYLGKLLGKKLAEFDWIKDVDLIIPVPLHKSKERKRGYNQSAVIIDGIKEKLNIESDYRNLQRKIATKSQTRKNRFARWKNVSSTFSVKNPHLLKGKHILIVDDIVTTGSTLIACTEAILSIPDTKVSIATIAYA